MRLNLSKLKLHIKNFLTGNLSLKTAVLTVYLPLYVALKLIKWAIMYGWLDSVSFSVNDGSVDALIFSSLLITLSLVHLLGAIGLGSCAMNSAHRYSKVAGWIVRVFAIFMGGKALLAILIAVAG